MGGESEEDGREGQYVERADRQREEREGEMSHCRQSGRKRYSYLRKGTIREMACLQINWN